jgi:hypothetical protein
MPQLDFDGANSKISADKIQGQSGTTVTIPAGHNLAGDGSGLTSLSAANLTGTVATARLGSGATSTTFLRGDQTYAAAGGGLVFISSVSASASAYMEFTGIDSTYTNYFFTVDRIKPATNTQEFELHIYSNGAYVTSNYINSTYGYTSGGNLKTSHVSYGSAYNLTDTMNWGGNDISGQLYFNDPSAAASYTPYNSYMVGNHSDGSAVSFLSTGWQASGGTTITQVKFQMASGNINSGEIRMYGIVDA